MNEDTTAEGYFVVYAANDQQGNKLHGNLPIMSKLRIITMDHVDDVKDLVQRKFPDLSNVRITFLAHLGREGVEAPKGQYFYFVSFSATGEDGAPLQGGDMVMLDKGIEFGDDINTIFGRELSLRRQMSDIVVVSYSLTTFIALDA